MVGTRKGLGCVVVGGPSRTTPQDRSCKALGGDFQGQSMRCTRQRKPASKYAPYFHTDDGAANVVVVSVDRQLIVQIVHTRLWASGQSLRLCHLLHYTFIQATQPNDFSCVKNTSLIALCPPVVGCTSSAKAHEETFAPLVSPLNGELGVSLQNSDHAEDKGCPMRELILEALQATREALTNPNFPESCKRVNASIRSTCFPASVLLSSALKAVESEVRKD